MNAEHDDDWTTEGRIDDDGDVTPKLYHKIHFLCNMFMLCLGCRLPRGNKEREKRGKNSSFKKREKDKKKKKEKRKKKKEKKIFMTKKGANC